MKTNTILRLAALLAAPFVALSSAHAQTLVLDYESANYIGTTWVDSSSSSNNGSAYAGGPSTTFNTTPNGSTSLDFGRTPGGSSSNGNTTGLVLGALPGTADFTSAPNFTYEAVMNTGSLSANGIVIGQSTASPPGNTPALRINTDGSLDMAHQLAYDDNTAAGTVSANTWYVVAITVSGNTDKFYVNGVLVSTVTDGGQHFSAMTGAQIANGAGASGFDGSLASVRVYDGALDQSHITSDFNTLNALYLTTVPEPSSVALLMTAFGALSLCCFFGKVRRSAQI